MTISNKHSLHTLAALTLCAFHSVCADLIELSEGDILTGSITDLNAEGVTVDSALSQTPLEIKSDSIRTITFDTKKSTHENHVELITLSNGDTLPCKVISLDEKSLHISTWYAGKFSVPRQNIRSLQFGISQDKTIYAGTDAPSDWNKHEGRWTLTKSGYSCQGSGILSRQVEFPQNLRIRFDLSWQNTPNIAFRFCAENDKASTKQDCYEFTFGSAGLQLRRVLTKTTPASLFSIDLKPHEIDNQQLNIDLRINRDLGKITLFLDGKERGSWIDTFESTTGNYFIISNRTNLGQGCHIGNLRISHWQDGSRPQHQKKLTQSKADILIDTNDERRSGHIASIKSTNNHNRTVELKIPHSTKPLRVPDHRINLLIFASQEKQSTPPNSRYTAHMLGGGAIHLETPKLHNGKITTKHPILGPCTIDTSAVSRIVVQKK